MCIRDRPCVTRRLACGPVGLARGVRMAASGPSRGSAHRSDAGCTQPAHIAFMSSPSASPIDTDACSCVSTIVR
eukprot:2442859-Pleurochrysis_carterae.AAC.1